MLYEFQSITDVYKEVQKHKIQGKISEFPPYVTFQLVDQCNFKCIMCPRTYIESTKEHFNFELFKKAIDEIAQYGSLIRFIGFDEPLLYKHIKEAITYVKSRGLMLHITTNGLLLNSEIREHLVKEKVDIVILSFQGASKEEYSFMRAVPESTYSKVMENIKALFELKSGGMPYLKLTTTLTHRDSPHELETLYKVHHSFFDEIKVTGYTHFVQIEKSFNQPEIWEKLNIKQPKLVPNVKCFNPNHEMMIKVTGEIYPCCGSYSNALKVGSIKEKSLKEIWQSREINTVRKKTTNGILEEYEDCKVCPVRYQYEDLQTPVF